MSEHPTPTATLLEAIALLRTAETLMNHRVRALMGLRSSDFQAIQFLAAEEASGRLVRLKDLTVILGMTGAASTIIANRLVERDYITREADPDDKRSRVLTLTTTARQARSTALGTYPAAVHGLIHALPAAYAEQIRVLADDARGIVDNVATASNDS